MSLLAMRPARSPIGLDLGTGAIKAAQVIRDRRGFRLAAAVSLGRQDPGPELSQRDAERLGPALVRAGFRGRTLACALPAELSLHANIELPPRDSKAPLDQIAASELARATRAAPAGLLCAHWPISDADAHEPGPSRVVGAESARIEALLDSLGQIRLGAARLAAIALDTGPWALVRCLAPWLGEAEDVTVIADIGWRRCTLTIARGQRIIYERPAPGLGLEPLREALARDLSAAPETVDRLLKRLNDDDAPEGAAAIARAALRRQGQRLADEVERSLRFAAETGADGAYRLILAGGGASSALAAAVEAPLDGLAEVRLALPHQLIAGAAGAASTDPAMVCAIGLAMRMDR